MRLLITFLSLSALAICQQQKPAAKTAPSPASVADVNSQKAKAIIRQCIQALGGDKYLAITDIKQKGRGYGFYENAPQGLGMVYVRMYKYPDKERFELTKKRDWIIIHNGNKGYEITFRGSAEEDPKDLKPYLRRKQYALDYVLREWTKEKGTTYFFDGDTLVGPKNVHKVTLMNSADEGVTLYIDTQTGLPVKKSYNWRDPETREMQKESELYDEYHPEQGIQTPHVITRTKNGEMTSQRFIFSVAYNTGLNPSLFEVTKLYYNRMKK